MSPSEFQPARSNRNGFTMIETLIVIAAIGLLLAIGAPAYLNYQEQEDNLQAVEDIRAINVAVTKFLLANNKLPEDLSAVGMGTMLDPWGNPYQYISHKAATPKQRRKDKNLLSLNNDYDLYSVGKDGNSAPALNAEFSHDDIVRANNGKWVGKGEKY